MRRPDDQDLDQTAELDPLKREALGWVQHLTSGQATRADAAAMRRWRGQSPAHAAALAAASRLWKNVGPAGRNLRVRGQAPAQLGDKRLTRRAITRRVALGGGLAVAASAAGYAVVHPPLELWPSWAELAADYRTKTGEQRDLALADDVAIRLNTQTSLSIHRADGDDADRVRLIRGEASFATAPERARSLIVVAADGQVTAQSAKFDVRYIRGNDRPSVCVTCLAGQVSVEQRVGVERKIETIAVGAGQQLRYDGDQIGPLVTVDPELATAWQRGVLIFRSTPLADVVDEINRYRPGKIVLLNAALGRAPVSGRFRIDHIDDVLARIELAFGAKMRALPGGFVLLS